MSDSVILCVHVNEKDALNRLVRGCLNLQIFLIELNRLVLLRGGISKGNFYYNDYCYFGPALVEAYQLEESANYPRIIFSKSLTKLINTDNEIISIDNDNKIFIDYLHFYIYHLNNEHPNSYFYNTLLKKLNFIRKIPKSICLFTENITGLKIN